MTPHLQHSVYTRRVALVTSYTMHMVVIFNSGAFTNYSDNYETYTSMADLGI